jgi:glycogen synthase
MVQFAWITPPDALTTKENQMASATKTSSETETPPSAETELPRPKKMRIALVAWENGRVGSGLGVKIGGLGVVVEELPAELVIAAAKQDIDIDIVTLTPCFAHYDKSQLTKLDETYPATLDGNTFYFEAYEYIFPDGQKTIYFWDEWLLRWTGSSAIYPADPHMALRLYAAVSQAMAAYIMQNNFQTVHLHDYHVGLLPFYLDADYLNQIPVHLTIHNATYQGNTPVTIDGYHTLNQINLPGWELFHKYFDFFNNINPMRGCMLRVHETGGKITTVSGDLSASWGYAAELKMSRDQVYAQALAQKGSPPADIFVPNRFMDLFEKLPIVGITNGVSTTNRAENLPWFKADVLQEIQKKRGSDNPIFNSIITQTEMLNNDHNFTADQLETKTKLKRLLHLECFGVEPQWDPILMTVVGRLVTQKNLGLVADIIERTLYHDPGTKFIILASAPDGEDAGKAAEARFRQLAHSYPERVYYNSGFNLPLSKLIFAGGDFSLIPSRFEPCGLVDYEASLLGNVVIGRATGGLTKVSHCAYLYHWLDVGDYWGEANAFFDQIATAIHNYRHNRGHHDYLVRTAMSLDASWDRSAAQYVEMYRFGLLAKHWLAARYDLLTRFFNQMDNTDRSLFSEFFMPAIDEYGDPFDWALKDILQ